MAQIIIKHQPLSRFLSFLMQWYLSNKNSTPLQIYIYSRLVQWVSWYEEFVVKNGLHATANLAHAPKLASSKFYIYGQSRDSYIILSKFWSLPVMAPMLNPHCRNTLFFGSVSPLWDWPRELGWISFFLSHRISPLSSFYHDRVNG
jgi:hypothetical protein